MKKKKEDPKLSPRGIRINIILRDKWNPLNLEKGISPYEYSSYARKIDKSGVHSVEKILEEALLGMGMGISNNLLPAKLTPKERFLNKKALDFMLKEGIFQ
jgi:hypothetical protein